MIEVNTKQSAISKFNDYLRKCLKELSIIKEELYSSIEASQKLRLIGNSPSITDLLAVKDFVLQQDSSLEFDYQTIKNFGDNASLVISQVSSSYEKIFTVIKGLKNNNSKDLTDRIKDIDNRIVECNNYISGNNYDTSVIINLLDSSDLSIQEQIDVLVDIAYNISPSRDEIINEEKPMTDNNSKYDIVLKEAKEILVNYFGVLIDNSPQEMKDIINVSQIIGSMNLEDVTGFYSEKIVFKGLVYKIKNLIVGLNTALENKQDNKDELYEELIDSITSIRTLTVDNLIELEETTSNVMFLIDKIGNPMFSTSYDQGDLDKIGALITKLVNVPGTITNGRLIQDTWFEANRIKVYVKNFGDMYCSYLKMVDNKILIVDFAPKNSIYDETKSIVKKHYSRILEIIDLVRANDIEFYAVQKLFLEGFQDSINGGGRI